LQELRKLLPVSIQIVAGNPNLGSLLGWHLQQSGYTVYQSAAIQQAMSIFLHQQPSLVVLDADIPNGDGIEFCRWIYSRRRSLIFMISSRSSELDIVTALRSGADDYLTKPFGIQEFLARVEALTRRLHLNIATTTFLDYGKLQIDLVQRQVKFKGHGLDLTPQEFNLLLVLAQAEGTAVSRLELLQRGWPEDINNPRTVDTHILSLRKKLESDPQQPNLIQTVRNVGYRFNIEALVRPAYRKELSAEASSHPPAVVQHLL
jgi:two-component system, OmpR family, response regulator